VKTLSDLRGPDAPNLKRNAELRTIIYLVTQEHGAIGKHTPRLPGVERTKYVLTDMTLVEAKVEDDQDVHLAIQDKQGDPTDHNRRVPQRHLQRQRADPIQEPDR
jgi:hypothetical protein